MTGRRILVVVLLVAVLLALMTLTTQDGVQAQDSGRKDAGEECYAVCYAYGCPPPRHAFRRSSRTASICLLWGAMAACRCRSLQRAKSPSARRTWTALSTCVTRWMSPGRSSGRRFW